jgi:hypothetical protein
MEFWLYHFPDDPFYASGLFRQNTGVLSHSRFIRMVEMVVPAV